MASLHKVKVVHWVDPSTGKRVPAGTPKAEKKETESKKWYIHYYEGNKLKKVPAFKDKQASIAKMNELVKSLARGEAGLTDPHKEHLDREASEHLEDYLPVLRKRVKSDKYYEETVRILKGMLTACGVARLRELTAEVAENYLTRLNAAPNTRKKHHSAMSGFAKWLHKRGRIKQNFMLLVDVPTGGVQKKYRSLSTDELQRLLDATRQRPLHENLTIRRGPRKGQLLARVRPEVRAELEQLGRERALLYKTATLTGLRKLELANLRVAHLDFDHQPYPLIDLPGSVTKNSKDAKLFLLPQLANELDQWLKDTGKKDKPEALVFNIPEKLNLIFKRDMKAASVPLEDVKGGIAKFRSLRKSANVLLRKHGVPLKVRQLFMRHGDIRLTADTYDDATLLDMARDVVPALEKVNLR
jgi:integrase